MQRDGFSGGTPGPPRPVGPIHIGAGQMRTYGAVEPARRTEVPGSSIPQNARRERQWRGRDRLSRATKEQCAAVEVDDHPCVFSTPHARRRIASSSADQSSSCPIRVPFRDSRVSYSDDLGLRCTGNFARQRRLGLTSTMKAPRFENVADLLKPGRRFCSIRRRKPGAAISSGDGVWRHPVSTQATGHERSARTDVPTST